MLICHGQFLAQAKFIIPLLREVPGPRGSSVDRPHLPPPGCSSAPSRSRGPGRLLRSGWPPGCKRNSESRIRCTILCYWQVLAGARRIPPKVWSLLSYLYTTPRLIHHPTFCRSRHSKNWSLRIGFWFEIKGMVHSWNGMIWKLSDFYSWYLF